MNPVVLGICYRCLDDRGKLDPKYFAEQLILECIGVCTTVLKEVELANSDESIKIGISLTKEKIEEYFGVSNE